MQQILNNLLSNAIKFTPEGGPDHRRGRRRSARANRVAESWPTRASASPRRPGRSIFEKFRQGNAVLRRRRLTREYSGTGLGLSIVKELCKLLGGEITLESELGKGSTFTVRIPWIYEPPQAREFGGLDEEETRSLIERPLEDGKSPNDRRYPGATSDV